MHSKVNLSHLFVVLKIIDIIPGFELEYNQNKNYICEKVAPTTN
jgi:hypothetical protein